MATRIPSGLRKRVTATKEIRHQLAGNTAVQVVANSLGVTPIGLIRNDALLARHQLLDRMLDPRRDIDTECGYPKTVTVGQFKFMYDREGVAQRVVNVYPEETWSQTPEVWETEDADLTEFEEAWDKLQAKMNLWHWLGRVDEMSGIGHFGVLLLGLGVGEGESLETPVAGVTQDGEYDPEALEPPTDQKLYYVRAFDQSLVTIDSFETEPTSPRYGKPVIYSIKMSDPELSANEGGAATDSKSVKVHWSRIIHVADNRTSSEVFGVPRQRPVFNRLMDIRKTAGGSAEMFWKGAFPGYSFEVNPDLGDVEMDPEKMRAEFAAYSDGLQRYLALSGVSAKSLAPQVASPEDHIMVQIKLICITLGVPLRIFMGSEAAHLASTQDKETWNGRLMKRQEQYVSPMIIRPFIERLIMCGVLPVPGEDDFTIEWPNLNEVSDEDKATVAAKWTEALAKYVQGGVNVVVPEREYMIEILGWDTETADAILEAAQERIAELEEEEALAQEEAMLAMQEMQANDPNQPVPPQVPGKGKMPVPPAAGKQPAAKAPPTGKPAATGPAKARAPKKAVPPRR